MAQYLDYERLQRFWNKVKGLLNLKADKTDTYTKSEVDALVAEGGGGSGEIDIDLQVPITWAELKALRDNGQLVAGTQYRITDYECTTTQENTQSAGHVFDIIVTADSESVLNENAKAIQHEGDEYFATCDLNAWELKYCLDNDTTRFAWADEENGKGVIYRMIDEWRNDIPYDFKNIQFKRGIYDGDGVAPDGDEDYHSYLYTFSWRNEDGDIMDTSIFGNDGTLLNDEAQITGVYGNVMGAWMSYEDYPENPTNTKQWLNNNVFFSYVDHDGCYCGCYNNTFGNDCNSNAFGNNCNSNTFGNDCYSNTFGCYCNYNTFGCYCNYNTFGNDCNSNAFGNNCYNNTFGNNCYNNTFGCYCNYNTFGNDCNFNTFGNNCYNNTFGCYCYSNTFGNDCYSNTFGNDCNSNAFGNNCYNNTFNIDYFCYNILGNNVLYCKLSYSTGVRSPLQYIQVASGTKGTNQINSLLLTGLAVGAVYSQWVGFDKNGNYKVKVLLNTEAASGGSAINDVSIFAVEKEMYIRAPKGMLTESDMPIFARYTKSKIRGNRYNAGYWVGDRRSYKKVNGWIRPICTTSGDMGLYFGYDIQLQKVVFGDDMEGCESWNDNDYDYFRIISEGEGFVDWIEWARDYYFQKLMVRHKKLGIRIDRDGNTIVDYLPFSIMEDDRGLHFAKWQ